MQDRARIHRLSQSIVVALGLATTGLFFVEPIGAGWIVEILIRSYLLFLCTVMAHEGSHGHLGAGRAANDFWGRLALIPTMVPYTNFRKTHRMHHAFTNDPNNDPDYFVKPRSRVEIILRSLAVPHFWLVWLRRRGWLSPEDVREIAVNYALITVFFSAIAVFVGPMRIIASMVPSLVILSVFLWYPFAVKTHEGFSLGTPEERSHNYYGRFAYWFSLGLSMHRAHHLHPRLAWIQLRDHVEEAPGPFWRRFLFIRHIVRAG
jgi:fatty acid desaturase